MKFSRFVIPTLVLLLAIPRLTAQEALELSAEPTPIEENTPKPRKEKKEEKSEERSGARELEQSGKSIQEVMSSDKFKAMGLDKLSPEELKHLEEWLRGYRQATETKATEKATAEAKKKEKGGGLFRARLDQVFSRVDGTFTGISGRTVIKLEDGTTWKQANKEDRFQAQITDHPPVMVHHSPFGFKMRVVGTGEFYVNPVR